MARKARTTAADYPGAPHPSHVPGTAPRSGPAKTNKKQNKKKGNKKQGSALSSMKSKFSNWLESETGQKISKTVGEGANDIVGAGFGAAASQITARLGAPPPPQIIMRDPEPEKSSSNTPMILALGAAGAAGAYALMR
jgi:hypothetical protein